MLAHRVKGGTAADVEDMTRGGKHHGKVSTHDVGRRQLARGESKGGILVRCQHKEAKGEQEGLPEEESHHGGHVSAGKHCGGAMTETRVQPLVQEEVSRRSTHVVRKCEGACGGGLRASLPLSKAEQGTHT